MTKKYVVLFGSRIYNETESKNKVWAMRKFMRDMYPNVPRTFASFRLTGAEIVESKHTTQ